MSAIIRFNEGAASGTPAAGKSDLFHDSADGHLKRVRDTGSTDTVSEDGRRLRSVITNPEFAYAQRQVNTTATTYSSTSTRTWSADRWSHVNENASMQFQTVDTVAAPEAGLQARFYGRFVKTTSQGKLEIFQFIEAREAAPLKSRVVRVSIKAKNIVGSHTLRLGLLDVNAGATADATGSGIISAHGAAGVDPTFSGTNTQYLTPLTCESTGTISGNGVSCVLSSSWQRFSATFLVPSTCQNLSLFVWTDDRPAANDVFALSEMMLTPGEEIIEYFPPDPVEDFDRCLRYYQKTFALNVAPAQSAGVGSEFIFQAGKATAVTQYAPTYRFQRPMRIAPTATTFNPSAGNAQVRDVTAGADTTATTVQQTTDRALTLNFTGAAGTAVGNQMAVNLTLDAEF